MTIADWVAVLVAVPGVISGIAAIPQGPNRPVLVGACGAFLVTALGLGVFATVRPSPAKGVAQAPDAATSGARGTASPATGTGNG